MKILPLAFDSLGTRSMATFVETKDCNILIDPGVALGPRRYGLPPHPLELRRREEHWGKISSFAQKSDILIVTHYHYDHFNPREPEIFKGKTALLKHPEESINRSQRWRSGYFLHQLEGLPYEIRYSDGKEFSFGNTKIKFSPPVFHGTNPKLGYVTEVLIQEEVKFLHTSDVEGPALKEQLAFILKEEPDILFCDGPMTYMLGYRYSHESLEESVKNLIRILQATGIKTLVLDHHFLRDLEWRREIDRVFEVADKEGAEVLTAAEFAGLKNDLLEARRRELYGK